MGESTLIAVLAGALVVLVALFSGVVLWLSMQSAHRNEALLKDMMARTMPAPITDARSVPPPETPEERAMRVGRGDFSREEISQAADRLAAKFGHLPGSADDVEREVAKLMRQSRGEVP